MGLETGGGVAMQMIERNMHIPTLKGQAFDTVFPVGLDTAG